MQAITFRFDDIYESLVAGADPYDIGTPLPQSDVAHFDAHMEPMDIAHSLNLSDDDLLEIWMDLQASQFKTRKHAVNHSQLALFA